MPTINDYKKSSLKTLTGLSTGDINTLEYKWLKSVVTPYVGSIPDMWRKYLTNLGYTSGALNDRFMKYLGSLGYTGSLNNRWYQYWKNGGGTSLTQSLFRAGENGFLFGNFAELDEMFTTSTGPTNVAVNDDLVGLALDDHGWGGLTFAQVTALQTELVTNGAFATDVLGWTATGTSPLITWQAGRMRIECGSASGVGSYQTINTVSGKTYRLRLTFPANNPGSVSAKVSVNSGSTPTFNGSLVNQITAVSVSSKIFIFTATAATSTIALYVNSATAGHWVEVDDVSVCEVPGNHALQATAANQPLWKANAGKPYLAFDGSNDALTLNSAPQPTSAGTVAVAARLVVAGVGDTHAFSMGTVTGNKRLRISFNSSGRAVFVFNDQATTVGDPLTGMDVVLVQTWGDGQRLCYMQGVAIVDEARVSNHDGTGLTPALGASEGATGGYLNGRISAALTLDRRVTPAEIQQITAEFRKTF